MSATQNPPSVKLSPGITLDQAVDQVSRCLQDAGLSYGHGVDNPQEEARWLVLAATNQQLGQQNYAWNRPLSERQINAIALLLTERITSRKPLAYLLGETWFAGYPFFIDERALVPRSFIAEWIQHRFEPWIDSSRVDSILDLCCGSGCIGIAAALEFTNARLVLSDLSADALQVAKINVGRHNLQHRTRIQHGRMFDGIEQKFDLIVCNPPYVCNARMAKLPPEYLHEPALALRAGADGLDFLRPLLKTARPYLNEHGAMIVEAGSASTALEMQCPTVPFNWMMTAHDETVLFAMSATELDRYQAQFDAD